MIIPGRNHSRLIPLISAIISLHLLVLVTACDQKSDTSKTTSSNAVKQTQPRPAPKPKPLPAELNAVIQTISRGGYTQSRIMARDYLDKHPQDGRGYFVIAYSYFSQDNHGPAVPYFEKALELSPNYYVTHHYFGECLFLLGEMDASRREHEAHYNADPYEPDAHYGIGLIDLEESKLEDAETRFRDALKLYDRMKKTNARMYDGRKPRIAMCHARLADVYFAKDNYEAARDELIKATTISPGTISALYTLSVVYRRLGEDELAEQTLKRYEDAKAAIIRRQQGGG